MKNRIINSLFFIFCFCVWKENSFVLCRQRCFLIFYAWCHFSMNWLILFCHLISRKDNLTTNLYFRLKCLLLKFLSSLNFLQTSIAQRNFAQLTCNLVLPWVYIFKQASSSYSFSKSEFSQRDGTRSRSSFLCRISRKNRKH